MTAETKAPVCACPVGSAALNLSPAQAKAQWLAANLKDGELYAGLILGLNDDPDYHLVLLPSRDNKTFTWDKAMEAAKESGGDLPTRREQSLLYANLKAEFKPTWHWSSEQYAADPSSAWGHYFNGGNQYGSHKSYEGRARAVRRLEI